MELYLVRHGKAEPGDDDARRRLTPEGREMVQRVARSLDSAGIRVDRIEHSGLLRAAETAEILAPAVGGEVASVQDLAAEADVVPVAGRLRDTPGDRLMLVGHVPFMERMASYLLAGDPDASILHFSTG